jgi:hypothetical protein
MFLSFAYSSAIITSETEFSFFNLLIIQKSTKEGEEKEYIP